VTVLTKYIKALSNNIDWVICIIFSIFIVLISFYFLSPKNECFAFSISTDGTLYLLSAISQALATIFTLVFTVTLMVATMANKYSAVDKFFNNKTKTLMVLFIVGIILPFLLLRITIHNEQIYNIFISISIGLAAFCVVAIIPYLKSSNYILKFDIGVDNLIGELNESVKSGNYSRATTNVYDLSELVESAIKDRNNKPIIKFSNVLPLFIITALEDKTNNFSPFLIIHIYGKIALDVTNAKMDDSANPVVSELLNSGKILIDKNVLDGSVDELIFTLHKIGLIAAEKHLEKTLTSSLRSLLTIYKVTYDNLNFESDSESANKYFWVCAARLMQDWPEQENIIFNVINYLGMDINSALPTKSIEHIKTQYPNEIEFLEKFIQYKK